MEEPQIHLLAARGIVDDVINPEFMLKVFNNTVKGLRAKTEVWCHTCWGNPSQQRMFAKVQSYKPALDVLNRVDAMRSRLKRPVQGRWIWKTSGNRSRI